MTIYFRSPIIFEKKKVSPTGKEDISLNEAFWFLYHIKFLSWHALSGLTSLSEG